MRRWHVRIENHVEIEAETEADARYEALNDMAFGKASMAEAQVTDIYPLESVGGDE